jgi:hypothetical protein
MRSSRQKEIVDAFHALDADLDGALQLCFDHGQPRTNTHHPEKLLQDDEDGDGPQLLPRWFRQA